MLFQSVERNGHPEKKIHSFFLKYAPWFELDSGSILASLSTGESSRNQTRDGHHLSCVFTPLLSSTNIFRNNTRGFTCLLYMRCYQYVYVSVLKCFSSEIHRQEIQEQNINLFLISFSCKSLLWLFLLYLWESVGCTVLTLMQGGYLSVLAQANWGGITLEGSNSGCNRLAQLCRRWLSISLYLSSPQLPLPDDPKTCKGRARKHNIIFPAWTNRVILSETEHNIYELTTFILCQHRILTANLLCLRYHERRNSKFFCHPYIMLEAEKGSWEKIPSTEAITDISLHSCSAFFFKSYCPHYNQTCRHGVQTNGWKSPLRAARF